MRNFGGFALTDFYNHAFIQKACATIKIPVFGSGSLSIYRWSQQALDTPMDHPLLPLLWQNFFVLFLMRVPSTTG